MHVLPCDDLAQATGHSNILRRVRARLLAQPRQVGHQLILARPAAHARHEVAQPRQGQDERRVAHRVDRVPALPARKPRRARPRAAPAAAVASVLLQHQRPALHVLNHASFIVWPGSSNFHGVTDSALPSSRMCGSASSLRSSLQMAAMMLQRTLCLGEIACNDVTKES